MRHFATTNNLSGVIKRTSVKPGATIITKVSEAEAKALAAIPTYFSATVDPNPGTDNTFKIAFSTTPVRGKYAFGTVVTITKQAGFAISSVLVNGEEVEEADSAFTFTITEPVDIDVTTLELFTVTLDPATGNFTATYDTEAIGGKYTDGTVVTIEPAEGHSITGVEVNGSAVTSTDGTYAIGISADTTVAITTAASYTVTLDPVTGDFTAVYSTEAIAGKYVTGTTVTIAATAGFEITALTANATPVDAEIDGTYIVTITADTTIAITTAAENQE